MNNLHELRSTLDRHASDLVDHELSARVGSVRGRVRVIRRRRQAAGAVTAVAALAMVASVALLPGPDATPNPAPAKVAGVTAPSTITSLGYRYELVRGVEGQGTASVDLATSDRPRLVSWATTGEDDEVDVSDGSGTTTSYDVADFTDFVSVGPGADPTVSVAAGGEEGVGLAIYELVGDGSTFRQRVAGSELIASVIGEPGQAEVSVDATASSDGVTYRAFCAGAPATAVVHIENADGDVVRGGCIEGRGLPFDPGAGSGYAVSARSGDDVSATVRISQTEGGPTLESDSVVVGIAIYDNPSSQHQAAGSDTTPHLGAVPDLIEHEGHLYRFDRLVPAPQGEPELSVAGTGTSRPVLAVGYSNAGEATVVFGSTNGGETTRSEGIPIGNAVIGLLSDADVATVRVLGDAPAETRLAIALYVLAD